MALPKAGLSSVTCINYRPLQKTLFLRASQRAQCPISYIMMMLRQPLNGRSPGCQDRGFTIWVCALASASETRLQLQWAVALSLKCTCPAAEGGFSG